MSAVVLNFPQVGTCFLCEKLQPRAELIELSLDGGGSLWIGPCCRTEAALSLYAAGCPANDCAPLRRDTIGLPQLELDL